MHDHDLSRASVEIFPNSGKVTVELRQNHGQVWGRCESRTSNICNLLQPLFAVERKWGSFRAMEQA